MPGGGGDGKGVGGVEGVGGVGGYLWVCVRPANSPGLAWYHHHISLLAGWLAGGGGGVALRHRPVRLPVTGRTI